MHKEVSYIMAMTQNELYALHFTEAEQKRVPGIIILTTSTLNKVWFYQTHSTT